MLSPNRHPFTLRAILAATYLTCIYSLSGADNTSALQSMANDAASSGTAMVIPSGTYQISAPIEIMSSVKMEVDTKIVATASMSAVFRVGSSGPVKDITISGGVLEANNLANDGLWLRQYRHAQVTAVKVQNAVANGFHFGDSSQPNSWEGIGTNLYVMRTFGTFQKGSVALFVESNASDSNFNQAVLVGMDEGVKVMNGGNFFSNIHVWAASSMGMMSIGFDDYGNGNFWNADEADTVLTGLWAHGYNTMVSLCRFYNNSDYGSTSAVGIQFDKSAPYATVGSCVFSGTAGHYFVTDVQGATPQAEPSKVLRWVGNVTTGVTNVH